jgi:methionyl-tRNA formyltransferase
MGRIVLMGSPAFALPAFDALRMAGHEIPLVLSQPARPAGRGRRPRPTAVADWAREQGLPLETPERLRDPLLAERLRALAADLFVVVAYRILPPSLFAASRLGAVNLHASLLPDWRGAAPIQRALMAGARRSGLSVFQIEQGVDTGQVLARLELEIGPDETAGELGGRMALAGAPLLADAVAGLLAGRAWPRPQPAGEWRKAPKLGPADRVFDPAHPARELHNRVRALAPQPGALAHFRGEPCKLLRTRLLSEEACAGEAGTLRAEGRRLILVCAPGRLELLELAAAGRRPMDAAAWLNGVHLQPEERLLAPPSPEDEERA